MSWLEQAGIFFKEVKATKAREVEEESISKEDMEFVSSASEARLLDVPQGASFLVAIAIICTLGIIIWSLVMKVDEVVKAKGKVIPSKQVQVIQNLEGGIIKEIRAMEGQSVKKGDVLIVIDDVSAQSDLSDNVHQYNALLARFVALNTIIDGKRILNFPAELQSYTDIMSRARERFHGEWDEGMGKIKALEFVIDQKKKEMDDARAELESTKANNELAQEEHRMNKQAYEDRIISKLEYLPTAQKANDAKVKYTHAKNALPKSKSALHEAMQKREDYMHEAKVKFQRERAEIEVKLKSMQSKGVSLKAKASHTIVKSPVDGTVKKINFNTVGGVIRPGMDIMEIVPSDDKLLIEVKVKPKDIGFIHKELVAKVKLTAFDFSTYGGLDGKVKFVSADTITDKKGVSFFIVRVLTDTNYIKDKKGVEHIIIPGMQTEVGIVVDKKSILNYVLKPMLK